MIGAIDNKRAYVELVKVKKVDILTDLRIAKDIKKYKNAVQLARSANNQELYDVYRAEIKRLRQILRSPRGQTYVFDVTLKKYKTKHQIMMTHVKGTRKEYIDFINEVISQAIRVARQKMKLLPNQVKLGTIIASCYISKTHGKVYAEEGLILKAHVKKNMHALLDCKTPKTQKRYIGIELEFCAPIKEENFAVKLFQRGIHKYAQLKQDGSLRPKEKEYGFELAILLEESNYKKGLKKITDLLKSVNASAKDRRCGLHVHLDMRKRDKDLTYNNLVACQYALLSIVDPSRYNNEFCKLVKDRKFPTEFTGERQERYKTINAAAYYKYRTLEVRMHEGSIDFNEITNWVDLLIKLANYPKRLKNDITRLPVLNSKFKLQKKLYNYALERSCAWQIENVDNMRQMRHDIAELNRNRVRPPDNVPNNFAEQANEAFRQRFFDAPIHNFEVAGVAAAHQAVGINQQPIFDQHIVVDHNINARMIPLLHDEVQEMVDNAPEMDDDNN